MYLLKSLALILIKIFIKVKLSPILEDKIVIKFYKPVLKMMVQMMVLIKVILFFKIIKPVIINNLKIVKSLKEYK